MHRRVDGAGLEVPRRERGQQRGRLAEGRATEQVVLIGVAGPDEVAVAGEALTGVPDWATRLRNSTVVVPGSPSDTAQSPVPASACAGTLASPTPPATTADAVITRRRDSLLSGAGPDPARAWFSLSWP